MSQLIVILLSEFGSASNTLPFAFWMWRSISKNAFTVKFFPASLPLAHHPFPHNHCPHLCHEFTCTKLPWLHIQNLSSGSRVNIPRVSDFLYNFIIFPSNFICSIITFFFFAAISSLLTNCLFQLSIFVKCHVGLSLSDKKTILPLLSITELSNMHHTHAGTDWKKWCDQLLIIDACLLFT